MMRPYKRLSFSLLAVLVLEFAFPWIASLKINATYAYSQENASITENSSVSLKRENTSFTVRMQIQGEVQDENDVLIEISDGNTSKTTTLDLEGEEAITGTYFSSPVHFEPTKWVSAKITSRNKNLKISSELIALDTKISGYELALDPNGMSVHAAGSPVIVSRAEWGANEKLRYSDFPFWKNYLEKEETGVSEATKQYRERVQAIRKHLESVNSEEFDLAEVINEEGGHELVWPIEKTKYVRKIVLHHTAENNLKALDDEELIRSMYYYHTITRGWGDIGYNYVVGQRGVIYE